MPGLILDEIESRNLIGVRRAALKHPEELNAVFDDRLPIVEAVDAGPNFVEELVVAGADIEAVDSVGLTALLYAATQGRLDVVKTLIALGAEVNAAPGSLVSPLSGCVLTRSYKHLDVTQALINAGADVNAPSRTEDGRPTETFLMAAASSGNLEAVAMLLQAEADPNTVTLTGTALTAAIQAGAAEVVGLLMSAGADPTICLPNDPDRLGATSGKSPMELAKATCNRRVITKLDPSARGHLKSSKRVKDAWKRLERALGETRREVLSTLHPPTPPATLRLLAETLGRLIPAEAEDFFEAHDGQIETDDLTFITAADRYSNSVFRLLSVNELIQHWQDWSDQLAAGDFRKKLSLPDPGIRDDWFHPGWIPFTTDQQGNFHCVDLAPDDGGTECQIILLHQELEERTIVAESLVDWLDELADRVEAGVATGV